LQTVFTVLSATVPKCQNIKKGGLDQYGAERFGRLIFVTIEKCGTKRVNCTSESDYSERWRFINMYIDY